MDVRYLVHIGRAWWHAFGWNLSVGRGHLRDVLKRVCLEVDG